ncbi:MAG: dihydrodipicolinate reductase [Dehalococcoidia bacterium]
MTKPVRALLFGVGAIGAGIGRCAAERDDIELVGAVDSAPERAGQPLYEALEAKPADGRANPAILTVAGEALAATKPDIVLHATGSYLPDVLPQLLACVRHGANVVSTCEELSFPWIRHPELAKQLDAEAKAGGATLLGTGINPGFVMDTLAVALSAVCQRVEAVRTTRIVDVGKRRIQLQRKVGVGLSVEEFREKAATGRFGHVGLKESCWMLAEGLGWRLDTLEETIDPFAGADGKAAGMRQTATGTLNGRNVIEAVVQMSTGAERPRDEIEIDGTPPVRLIIEGGVMGDTATAAVIVNAVPRVVAHEPGLVTMLDLPVLAAPGVWP